MITEKEMILDNISYINKDFQNIYPELLDLTQKLTDKWNPSQSNESDPGNVLLKLASAVADKNNYNIDKNVLECFMPSATQETSMRRLTEMVGYNMKYYQSAMTDITFKYTDELEEPITFNKFDTVVSNSDNTITYVLLEPVILSYKNVAQSGIAIEGSLQDLLVSDSKTIKLSNLTDDNKIYFPDMYVAENGVFICNVNQENYEDWTRVDNLNTVLPLSKVYKFGYDSEKSLPYIEFSSDIAQIIDNGINIKYTVTNGESGNVLANTLTELKSSNNSELETDNLIILNASATDNGRDKETIDEAYNNFKKIIGTFTTLVTTRDYSNAMYNAYDEYDNPIVSNAVASDRRTDINSALEITSLDKYGQYTELVDSDMSSQDISLYPLKPYNSANYNYYNPSYVYDDSFMPLKKSTNNSSKYVDTDLLTSALSENKCISQDYKTMQGNVQDENGNITTKADVYCFKNIATLDAQIYTYTKVNAIAQADIKANILKALSDNFNARMLDYGYEIPYDTLVNVIVNSDSRIKMVNLLEPTYTTNVMRVDGSEENIFVDGDAINDITTKNVLAGRISLFSYDKRFDWKFGMTNQNIYDNLENLSTDLVISVSENTGSKVTSGNPDNVFKYTIGDNENIQLTCPKLNDSIIYPAGVKYSLQRPTLIEGKTYLNSNVDYKLQDGEQLYLTYTDENNKTVQKVYTTGTIILPTFDLYYEDSIDSTDAYITIVEDKKYKKVATDNTITIREFSKLDLQEIGTPVFWKMNNSSNILFSENQKEVILNSGEYFIYSNSALDDLIILGAGTKIVRNGTSDGMNNQWNLTTNVSLESINNYGLKAFTSADWVYKNFTTTDYLTLSEMQITTLTSGTTLSITDLSGISNDQINSDYQKITCSNLTYTTFDGIVSTLQLIDETIGNWEIRTRLDILAGPNNPQILLTNNRKNQTVTIKPVGEESVILKGTDDGTTNLIFNYDISLTGGDNIDLLVTNLYTGNSSYSLSCDLYTQKDSTMLQDGVSTTIDTSGTITQIIPSANNKVLTLPISLEKFNKTSQVNGYDEDGNAIESNVEYQPYATYIVPILLEAENNSVAKINLSSNSGIEFREYNTDDLFSNSLDIVEPKLHNIELQVQWLGTYSSVDELNTERPYSKEVIGEDGSKTTIYPNTDGDMCRVVNETTTSENGLYIWVETTKSWTLSYSGLDTNITITLSPVGTTSSESLCTIGKIYKIKDINSAISTNIDGDAILSKIKEYTKDKIPFYYVLTPENESLIEVDDISQPNAFWDVNNIANKFTIAKLDLTNSNIYIAKASQL